MPSSGNKPDPDRPDYNVYRSRRGLFSRFRKPDLGSLSGKEKQAADRKRAARADRQDLPYEVHRSGSGGGGGRSGSSGLKDRFGRGGRGGSRGGKRWLKWILITCFGWFCLSVLAFGVSAQIQSMKLSGDAKDALGGSPWILTSPQNILIIGTDSRPPDTLEPGAAEEERCYEQQAEGQVPHDGCPGARADTLMVVRAGGGKFKKLGIPRDSYAAIPGQDTQKINAAYAFGGAALQIKTVENFLGITIDHVVILNFTGFEDFIDAIGGVKVDVPVRLCADISGGEANGGWSIDLKKGSNTLDGETALAYSRTRKPSPCPGSEPSAYTEGYDDLDRAAAQQLVMNGIKQRLTDPLRLPYNFIKGPIIGWTAPKAFVSDMGFFTLPQLALSSVFASSSKPDVLVPSGNGPAGSLEIPESERQRAAAALES
ncbi:MAG: LCP family protein [Solirubrobacterales bacterium]|nr:LCP family protein [Solirubrobacterales bacterium]